MAGGGGHGGEGGHQPPLPGHQAALGGQSISAVSTVSTVTSEHWAASPILETECSANFNISENFTNYLFNIRDISRYLIDTKYKMLENIR